MALCGSLAHDGAPRAVVKLQVSASSSIELSDKVLIHHGNIDSVGYFHSVFVMKEVKNTHGVPLK